MAKGWPAMANGEQRPEHLVVKQARSLDPGLRGIPLEVLNLGVRRDVLARARQVARVTCPAGEHVEILTDPLLFPDVGYAESPLILGTADTSGSACETEVLHGSPGQYLLGLLDADALIGPRSSDG